MTGIRKILNLNEEQACFFKAKFCMPEKDFPSDFWELFWELQDFIKIVIGVGVFRGQDYEGNGQSFADDLYLSYTANKQNPHLFRELSHRLECIYIRALFYEYYELANNVNTIFLAICQTAECAWLDDNYEGIQDRVDTLLMSLNISVIEEDSLNNDDLPF